MPFSQAGPTGYLTPPPSPGESELDTSSLLGYEYDGLPDVSIGWASHPVSSQAGRHSPLADHKGCPQFTESPSELNWLKFERLRLQESLQDSNLWPKPNTRPMAASSDPFRRRPAPRASNTGSSSKPSSSLRAPDRFLPIRSPLDAVFHRFQISKDSHKLSDTEKLLRQDIASTDAFHHRRRATSPIPSSSLPVSARVTGEAHVGAPTALHLRPDSSLINGERRASIGSAWTVGGLAPLSIGVSDGRGGLISSGTNAPLYTTSFASVGPRVEEELERHESRLAKALDFDRTQRIFAFVDPSISPLHISPNKRKFAEVDSKTVWNGTEWVTEGPQTILDAPNLRDDFYCSILAYSPTGHTLAVGLGNMLYAWSEKQGVHLLSAGTIDSWLTSIAFSSTQGCRCILAYGRSDGNLTLMSLYDRPLPRFEVKQPCPIACLTWRPTTTLRPSRSNIHPEILIKTEDLIVGDELGNVYYYSVEWPEAWEVDQSGWSGAMTLLARISIHSQQICGLAWSYDGTLFATGGNDNLCFLFEAACILQPPPKDIESEEETFVGNDGAVQRVQGHVKTLLAGSEKHCWVHGAAVKAIAFCPWRDGLIATGGGTNDKCIHFFHAVSGACLATINVAAQVTSLIWSTTRREIVATFGYPQPEHPYRIAVFSWPGCRQIAAIPWEGEHRALCAIAYPGGPNESHERSNAKSRTAQEGCIVVAASDESVKFHEVWSAGRKATAGGEGLLGGSDILESLEGNDREGEVIR